MGWHVGCDGGTGHEINEYKHLLVAVRFLLPLFTCVRFCFFGWWPCFLFLVAVRILLSLFISFVCVRFCFFWLVAVLAFLG